jgi:hypothetical protein
MRGLLASEAPSSQPALGEPAHEEARDRRNQGALGCRRERVEKVHCLAEVKGSPFDPDTKNEIKIAEA